MYEVLNETKAVCRNDICDFERYTFHADKTWMLKKSLKKRYKSTGLNKLFKTKKKNRFFFYYYLNTDYIYLFKLINMQTIL